MTGNIKMLYSGNAKIVMSLNWMGTQQSHNFHYEYLDGTASYGVGLGGLNIIELRSKRGEEAFWVLTLPILIQRPL